MSHFSKKTNAIFFAFLLFLPVFASAQTLESFERVGQISAPVLSEKARTYFGNAAPASATDAMIFYRVNYRSRDARNKLATLSGLLAIPEKGAPRGLVVWHHGTISDPKNAPSRWKTDEFGGANEIALMALASGGYAVAMPDYPGFGANQNGAHPYPMGKPNAVASVDMIAPARVVAQQTKLKIGAKLFLGGYSQGGAAAMWSARILQSRGILATRTAALSGPYDLTKSTLEPLVAAPQNDTQFAAQLFLAGLMAHGYARASGTKLTEIFRPTMALAVRSAFGTPQSENESVQGLIVTAKLTRARSLQDVLTPKFFQIAKRGDISHPLVRQLRESDVYDWAPRSPMLLWTLQSDNIVSAENTRRTLNSFRARGVKSDRVRALFYVDKDSDHIKSFTPALLAMRRFFDSGFAGVPDAR